MGIRDERKHLRDCYNIISAMMSTLLGIIDTADYSGMQLSLPFPSALGSSRIPQKCRIPAQRPLRGRRREGVGGREWEGGRDGREIRK